MLRALGAAALLAVFVAAVVFGLRWLAPDEHRPSTGDPKKAAALKPPVPEKKAGPPPAASKPPLYEVAPTPPAAPKPAPPDPDALHAALPPAPPEPPVPKPLPRAAIIIDDLGYDRLLAEKFIELKAPLTVAVLPHSPHQEAIARLAHERGLEVMLHLPMEPMEYPDIHPGPGALLAAMTADELLQALEGNLKAVPHVKGVNNHMGSRLTARSEQMYQIFSVLKRRGLYFIDSRTSEDSVCRPSARLFQIPFAQRDVFLDNSQDPAAIRRQLKELVRIALRKGEAIAIGHPHPSTLAVLKEELPALRRQLDIIPASRLVRAVE